MGDLSRLGQWYGGTVRELSRLCPGFQFGPRSEWCFFIWTEAEGEAGLEVPRSPPEAEPKTGVFSGE